MSTWFTSDLHFGHSKIIEYCDRPFSSVEEMNERLVDNFNSVVGANDEVYILGDICMGRVVETHKHLLRLNGKLHWILGNHDKRLLKIAEVSNRFEWIDNLREIYVSSAVGEKLKVVLCHFPMLSWNQSHRGSIMLHGHRHSKDRLEVAKFLARPDFIPRIFDVGVDANNFSPINLEDLLSSYQKLLETHKQ